MYRRLMAAAVALGALGGGGTFARGESYTVPDLRALTVTRLSDGAVVSPNAIRASTSGLDAIGVPTMRVAHPQITGAGQTVVVIDTGIDYTHPALASNYLTGYDFVSNTADPMDNWAGGGGHGTHVTGIIASTSATYPGVAPGAKVISLKVFDPATGSADDATILAALNWVGANRAAFNITTVNMSMGDGVETTWSKIAANDPYGAAMQTLKNQGVFVAVASGNDAYLHGQSMPAASRYAVSVGATYVSSEWENYAIGYGDPAILDPYKWPDINGVMQSARDIDNGPRKDDIAFFANRYKTAADGSTSLMAPGIFITSTVPVAFDEDGVADGYMDMGGTSMASPQVAGAAMLVRQALEESGKLDADPSKQVDQIVTILQETGTPLLDYFSWFGGNNSTIMEIPPGSKSYYLGRGTGETYMRIDVGAAVEAALPEPGTLGVMVAGAVGLLVRRRR